VLFPEGVLVNLPVSTTVESEHIADERLCLLPHFVGLLGDELVLWRLLGLWVVRFVDDDSLGERDIAGTRGCDDSTSALLYSVTQFLAEAFVPRAPERRLVRERLEAELPTLGRIRSQVIVESGFVPAVDLLNEERPDQ
jgi:hypothetical protein